MKVIAINGSSREKGNTSIVIETVLKELRNNGIETEVIQLSDKILEPCHACFTCVNKKECSYQKDQFNKIFQKMIQADGIILGSPVYSADISSNMKALIDRASVICDMNTGILKHKIGVGIVCCRRGGAMSAIDTLNHFFLNKEMIVVGSIYWNMVYGQNPGDVINDLEGIENMKNLGKNMAYILKRLNS